MNSVPITLQVQKALRLHIGIFGCRNAGKSSLINRLTNQELSIVSDVPGTTTDPVEKACELHPIGPVVLIDTAGIDDTGAPRTNNTGRLSDRITFKLTVYFTSF